MGHYTVYPGATPTTYISLVNLREGAVSEIKTVPNPMTVRIDDGKLYVGSFSEPKMDIFDIASLNKISTVTFDDKIIIPVN
ncbi:hypothetical protein [Paenibacillus elgii]|uniref:hypothetical protein n=1 Tax=Paenibacillus elgii TaxID=189691 RepID=UPI0013D15871|nr:hypothetical protein [Paenibacillus elgii]